MHGASQNACVGDLIQGAPVCNLYCKKTHAWRLTDKTQAYPLSFPHIVLSPFPSFPALITSLNVSNCPSSSF